MCSYMVCSVGTLLAENFCPANLGARAIAIEDRDTVNLIMELCLCYEGVIIIAVNHVEGYEHSERRGTT